MKTGARNNLTGKITQIKKGDIMAQVKVEIDPGAAMSSVMTVDSLNDLNIAEGDQVKLIVKAVNVLIVKD